MAEFLLIVLFIQCLFLIISMAIIIYMMIWGDFFFL